MFKCCNKYSNNEKGPNSDVNSADKTFPTAGGPLSNKMFFVLIFCYISYHLIEQERKNRATSHMTYPFGDMMIPIIILLFSYIYGE